MHGLILFLYFVIVGAILIHHGLTHNGVFFQTSDFYRAMVNVFNSHEGIIFVITIFTLGVLVAL